MANKLLCRRCKKFYSISLQFGELKKMKKRLCPLCEIEFQTVSRNFSASVENIYDLIDNRPKAPLSPETSMGQLGKEISEDTKFYLSKENGYKFTKRASGYKKASEIYKKWEMLYANEKEKLTESYYLLLRDFRVDVAPDFDPEYPNPKKDFKKWLDVGFDVGIMDWIRELRGGKGRSRSGKK